MENVFLRFPGGKGKAVTFSYDDGSVYDIRLSEIFTKYGLKGTFNLNSSLRRTSTKMTDEEIKEHIIGKGHEIAVHGAYHRSTGFLRPIEGIREVVDCRIELENRFDMIVRGMAYPNSGIRVITSITDYEHIRHYLEDLEIAYSRSLAGDNDNFYLPDDWYRWTPTAKHTNPQIFEYIDKFLSLDLKTAYGGGRYPRLFYVWGHSYEFETDNNWDRIEKICELLSKADDTWFATNIEICEYVKAYERLVHSADNSIIYNPTLLDIWFDADGSLYCIKPGETLKLKK